MYLIQFIETTVERATEPCVDDIYWQGVFESLETMSENLQDWILDWLEKNPKTDSPGVAHITPEFLQSLLEKGDGPHEVFSYKFGWKWASALIVYLHNIPQIG